MARIGRTKLSADVTSSNNAITITQTATGEKITSKKTRRGRSSIPTPFAVNTSRGQTVTNIVGVVAQSNLRGATINSSDSQPASIQNPSGGVTVISETQTVFGDIVTDTNQGATVTTYRSGNSTSQTASSTTTSGGSMSINAGPGPGSWNGPGRDHGWCCNKTSDPIMVKPENPKGWPPSPPYILPPGACGDCDGFVGSSGGSWWKCANACKCTLKSPTKAPSVDCLFDARGYYGYASFNQLKEGGWKNGTPPGNFKYARPSDFVGPPASCTD